MAWRKQTNNRFIDRMEHFLRFVLDNRRRKKAALFTTWNPAGILRDGVPVLNIRGAQRFLEWGSTR